MVLALHRREALPRRGNRSAAGDLYPTLGGGEYDFIYVLATKNRPMWGALATAVGHPDLADPEVLADPDRDLDAEMDAAVRSWTAVRDKYEAMRILGSAGVPAGAVLSGDDVLADPHVLERDMIVTLEDETYGPVKMLGAAIKLSASPANITLPPFGLGQHTEEVLAELGYSTAAISALRDSGAI